jgi:catechol 2,3-dioxygenase-like lactoylglutathione lyase family enzyme
MLDILRIHHVTVLSADAQASIDFYESVLGLRNDPGLGSSSPDFARLSLVTGQQIHLREGAAPPYIGQHFCLEVPDIRQAVGKLQSAGVPVRLPESGLRHFAHILDPSGNDIELRERR